MPGSSPPPLLPGPRWLLVVTATALLAAGVLVARLEEHEALRLAAGTELDAVRAALAAGSGAGTAWLGWVAAVLFALSLRRLLRGAPELPLGVGADSPVAVLRAAMRRELRLLRAGLAAVAAVAAVEVGRAAATAADAAGGPGFGRQTLGWTLVEAAGVLAAAAVLALHCAAFRRQCGDLGAV